MSLNLESWLEALAASAAPHSSESPRSPESWLDAAESRPAWMLWGKARPTSTCPAHPLICHMLDVAAVAARLLTTVLPPALRSQLLSVEEDDLRAVRTLLFVIALHDLGKATPAFQIKAELLAAPLATRGFDLAPPEHARHHGDIGCYFLYEALRARGGSLEVSRDLARAVTAHHGQFPTNQKGLEEPGRAEAGRAAVWNLARAGLAEELATFFQVGDLHDLRDVPPSFVVLLAGLTSVADWIGSMAEVFSYEPPQPSLASYWGVALERANRALEIAGLRAPVATSSRSFQALFDKTPWPLHVACEELAAELNSPSLVIIEAPMGEGKTEAALLLAEHAAAVSGQSGLYVGLPTRATANQMFGRIKSFLEGAHPESKPTLVLGHSEASVVEAFRSISLSSIFDERTTRGVAAEAWFLSKKRTLLAGYAVGTIDQALLAVMLTPHAFVRLFGLAGKTVVLDEVHAYDTYTGTLLERLLEWLSAAGTTVVLLSATLPSERRAALLRAYLQGRGGTAGEAPHADYPRITTASSEGCSVRRFEPRSTSLEIRLEQGPTALDELAALVASRARDGGCVGWICNTVHRAQRARLLIEGLCPEIGERLLIHARLFPDERVERESRLERWLGSPSKTLERPRACIVIGTQVLEQSLDIDFDLLVTDVAPVDLVLQRAGRLWRHTRPNRSDAHPHPTLVVATPQSSGASEQMKEVASVYSELLVENTLETLRGRTKIVLPDDIEPLVEQVYADVVPGDDDELLTKYLEHYGVAADKRNAAQQKLMPRPTSVDDPFGALRVFLDDGEDPRLHPELRADTRLGPPTVQLVCLERHGEQLFAAGTSERVIDLSREPDRNLEEQLVLSSIGTSRAAIVRALAEDPAAAPKSWQSSPLLRYRRLVIFENGRAEVGGIALELDPELGLVIGP